MKYEIIVMKIWVWGGLLVATKVIIVGVAIAITIHLVFKLIAVLRIGKRSHRWGSDDNGNTFKCRYCGLVAGSENYEQFKHYMENTLCKK